MDDHAMTTHDEPTTELNVRGGRGTVYHYETTQGKRWAYNFDAGRKPDGGRCQISRKGFATKTEARKACDKHREEVFEGAASKTVSTISFGGYLDNWLKTYGAENWEDSTQDTARRRAAYALAAFGDIQLRKLKKDTLKHGLLTMLKSGGKDGKPLGKKTVHEVRALIRQCLQHALLEDGLVKLNEMDRVKLPRIPEREVIRPSTSQFDAILERVSGTRYFMLITFAADAGCRRGEQLALTRSDIDFATREVTISKSLSVTSKGMKTKRPKNEKTRKLKLSEVTIELLKKGYAMLDEEKEAMGEFYENNDLVFCSPTGAYLSPDCITNRVSQFMREAGCPKGITLHKLRHYCASYLIAEGVPVTDICARLGHSDPSITYKIYSGFMPSNDDRAAAAFDRGMGAMVRARNRAAGEQEPPPPAKLAVVNSRYVTTACDHAGIVPRKLFKVKG